jgi:hypothetical protein
MISRVPSRRWEIRSERSTSSVATPPALGVSVLESEQRADVDPGVHTGEDDGSPRRHDRNVRFGEARGKGGVVAEKGVDLAHVEVSRVIQGRGAREANWLRARDKRPGGPLLAFAAADSSAGSDRP